MKTVNLGAPLNKRVTLRFTEEQFEYLAEISTVLGVSPSDYIRMMVNTSMVAYKNNELSKMITENREKVGMSSENVKTDFNYKL